MGSDLIIPTMDEMIRSVDNYRAREKAYSKMRDFSTSLDLIKIGGSPGSEMGISVSSKIYPIHYHVMGRGGDIFTGREHHTGEKIIGEWGEEWNETRHRGQYGDMVVIVVKSLLDNEERYIIENSHHELPRAGQEVGDSITILDQIKEFYGDAT